jgi:hypothetical protein
VELMVAAMVACTVAVVAAAIISVRLQEMVAVAQFVSFGPETLAASLLQT